MLRGLLIVVISVFVFKPSGIPYTRVKCVCQLICVASYCLMLT